MDDDDSGVIRFMRRVGVPLTRKNYLDLAYLGEASPPDELGAEEEAGLPARQREKTAPNGVWLGGLSDQPGTTGTSTR